MQPHLCQLYPVTSIQHCTTSLSGLSCDFNNTTTSLSGLPGRLSQSFDIYILQGNIAVRLRYDEFLFGDNLIFVLLQIYGGVCDWKNVKVGYELHEERV